MKTELKRIKKSKKLIFKKKIIKKEEQQREKITENYIKKIF
jgi:hypothetical protein